jgi:hypothetical protein
MLLFPIIFKDVPMLIVRSFVGGLAEWERERLLRVPERIPYYALPTPAARRRKNPHKKHEHELLALALVEAA